MAVAVKKLKSERFQGHKKWLVGLFLLFSSFFRGGGLWGVYSPLCNLIIHGLITDIISNSRLKLITLANFIIQIWLS